jgi:hypothetical protein
MKTRESASTLKTRESASRVVSVCVSRGLAREELSLDLSTVFLW